MTQLAPHPRRLRFSARVLHRKRVLMYFWSACFMTFTTHIAPAQGYDESQYREHRTAAGTRFVVIGDKPDQPKPVLLHFAGSAETTFANADFMRIARLLEAQDQEFLSVSIDLPHHGTEEYAKGNTGSLSGWAKRVAAGEDFVAEFVPKVSDVIDTLIDEGYAIADQITVSGTSRGGYMALHSAAVEPRLTRVICFAPVTDPRKLREYDGLGDNALAEAMDTVNLAGPLSERDVFICIGNGDERVGTDAAITTARAIAAAASDRERVGRVWLHVMPSEGHRPPAASHAMAADWLLERLGLTR